MDMQPEELTVVKIEEVEEGQWIDYYLDENSYVQNDDTQSTQSTQPKIVTIGIQEMNYDFDDKYIKFFVNTDLISNNVSRATVVQFFSNFKLLFNKKYSQGDYAGFSDHKMACQIFCCEITKRDDRITLIIRTANDPIKLHGKTLSLAVFKKMVFCKSYKQYENKKGISENFNDLYNNLTSYISNFSYNDTGIIEDNSVKIRRVYIVNKDSKHNNTTFEIDELNRKILSYSTVDKNGQSIRTSFEDYADSLNFDDKRNSCNKGVKNKVKINSRTTAHYSDDEDYSDEEKSEESSNKRVFDEDESQVDMYLYKKYKKFIVRRSSRISTNEVCYNESEDSVSLSANSSSEIDDTSIPERLSVDKSDIYDDGCEDSINFSTENISKADGTLMPKISEVTHEDDFDNQEDYPIDLSVKKISKMNDVNNAQVEIASADSGTLNIEVLDHPNEAEREKVGSSSRTGLLSGNIMLSMMEEFKEFLAAKYGNPVR